MRTTRPVAFTIIAVLALALLHDGSIEVFAQTECVQPLNSVIVEDTWDGDCLSENREDAYARYYTFIVSQESAVTITLESETDPYLFLLSGSGANADHLAENDDIDIHTRNLNSRIEVTLSPGNYTIEATTYERQAVGEFTLIVTGVGSLNDRAALTALYHATYGDNWTNNANWLSDAPLDDWHGVTTDDYGRVVVLELEGDSLTGHIPPELGNLNELQYLFLEQNQLTGNIPSEIGNLTNLRQLWLSGNQLTGAIPTAIGSLHHLQVLFLSDNQLTGEIPSELANIPALEQINLGGNQLTGCIPFVLRDISLDIYQLGLPFCGNPDRQVLVALYHATNGDNWTNNTNWLTDAPLHEWYGVGNDNSWNVHEIVLNDNRLTGQLNPELGELHAVKGISFANNQLTGDIPTELGKLNLALLDLSNNRLTGTIPTEIGKFTHLGELRLNNNQLTGSILSELANLPRLFRLFLAGNQLTGCIPIGLRDVEENDFDELGLSLCEDPDRAALTALYHATYGDNWTNNTNWLSDAPLEDWHGVTTDAYGRVTDLDLGRNDLSGHMPPELGNLSQLIDLYLNDNQLTGAIPPELGKLVTLSKLELEENQLTGTIPPELGNLTSLGVLLLNGNRLWGELPHNLTNLKFLEALEFDENSGLCAPADDEFQEWLDDVGRVHGDTCVQPTSSPDPQDIAALTALYNTTDGDNWHNTTNWFSEQPLQYWTGVSLNDEGRVAELRLWGNNLSG